VSRLDHARSSAMLRHGARRPVTRRTSQWESRMTFSHVMWCDAVCGPQNQKNFTRVSLPRATAWAAASWVMDAPSLTAEIASPRRFIIGLDYPKEIYSLVACMSLSYDNSGYSLLHERNDLTLTLLLLNIFLTYVRLIAQCLKLY